MQADEAEPQCAGSKKHREKKKKNKHRMDELMVMKNKLASEKR